MSRDGTAAMPPREADPDEDPWYPGEYERVVLGLERGGVFYFPYAENHDLTHAQMRQELQRMKEKSERGFGFGAIDIPSTSFDEW
jgi:hypothetical protein